MKDEALPHFGAMASAEGALRMLRLVLFWPVRTFSEHACHRGTWSTGPPNG